MSRCVPIIGFVLPVILSIGCADAERPRVPARAMSAPAALAAQSPVDTRSDETPISDPLDRADLVRAVLQRNPDIGMARASWRAALARQAQRSSWDDPMVSYGVAPATIDHGRLGQEIQVSQRLPIGGRLGLQGEAARAEADAARADIASVQLRLALMTSQIYDDYVLACRALVIAEEHRALIRELASSSAAHLANGQGSLRESLTSDAALADLHEQTLSFEGDRDVAVAQLDALLHREPTALLPAPASESALLSVIGSDEDLEEAAMRQRPELAKARASLSAARSNATLAQRQGYPDLSLLGSYNSMWDASRQQLMVGLSVSVPLQRDRIDGARDESRAMVERQRLELEHQGIEIRAEVVAALRRYQAALAMAEVLAKEAEPVAQQTLDSARIGLTTGTGTFIAVIAAERDLRDVRMRILRNRAEIGRRAAEVQRAIGSVPVIGTKETP